MRKIANVVGTRPQIIKASVLLPALAEEFEVVTIDTGQHYDESMQGQLYRGLGIQEPDYCLKLDPDGSREERAKAMTQGVQSILYAEQPDLVVVYGDTDSTVAATVAANEEGIPVAHVEAGLRSYNPAMPEEFNRIFVDHQSEYLFAPTRTAVENLIDEGVGGSVYEVGDLMHERLTHSVVEVMDPEVIEMPFGVRAGEYLFATVHRVANKAPEAIAEWVALFNAVATPGCPVLLALHPGTKAALDSTGLGLSENVHVIEPQDYLASIALQLHSKAVITDSGGIQREAAWMEVPCLVLREETEWKEAVEESHGKMMVIGTNRALAAEIIDRLNPAEKPVNLFNSLEVNVSDEIVRILINALEPVQ